MTKRLCVLLVCALTPALLVAACGGSSQSKTGATSGLSLKTVKHLNKVNTDRSVAACHQAANNPGLPADQKPLVLAQCEYIRTGNNVGLHQVDRQLCQVEAAAQPEPTRTKLLAQCKQL
ncbi:MAG TPA: hypothetical protein VG294_05840 [Solirubrobacteraceae bacterium]|jgi:hypothetical protein|nr:hypothetical protein [Solirubrobacteraceae bacterium]